MCSGDLAQNKRQKIQKKNSLDGDEQQIISGFFFLVLINGVWSKVNSLLVNAPKITLYVYLCNYMCTCLCSHICTHSMNFSAQNILYKLILHEISLHHSYLCSLFKNFIDITCPFCKNEGNTQRTKRRRDREENSISLYFLA